jgi:hypothetical protein
VPDSKKLKDGHAVRLPIWMNSLVRECDVRWNSIESSLTLFYRKMTVLGFTFDGIDVIRPNEGWALVHLPILTGDGWDDGRS